MTCPMLTKLVSSFSCCAVVFRRTDEWRSGRACGFGIARVATCLSQSNRPPCQLAKQGKRTTRRQRLGFGTSLRHRSSHDLSHCSRNPRGRQHPRRWRLGSCSGSYSGRPRSFFRASLKASSTSSGIRSSRRTRDRGLRDILPRRREPGAQQLAHDAWQVLGAYFTLRHSLRRADAFLCRFGRTILPRRLPGSSRPRRTACSCDATLSSRRPKMQTLSVSWSGLWESVRPGQISANERR